MKPIPEAVKPNIAAPRIESVSEYPCYELDDSLVAQARQNLLETHELLCEPACSSDLDTDFLLEM